MQDQSIKQSTSRIKRSDLHPAILGKLLVKPKDHPRGQSHLSAASGLVGLCKRWYVVADDELHLGIFDERPRALDKSEAILKGKLVQLLGGAMPNDKRQRKAVKPDFESLVLLPAFAQPSVGVLLALGSGSKSNRQTGVLIELDGEAMPSGRMVQIDLSPLYAPLRDLFADLNIEGAFLSDDDTQFILLHRGNQGDARSACIRYDWAMMRRWLIMQGNAQGQGDELKLDLPKATVQVIRLASVNGVPLSFTDGAALSGGNWVFSAVAEATMDSVQDGACVGSAVGVINRSGTVIGYHMLTGSPKVEGIAAVYNNSRWEVTLVTDPDDPKYASRMLRLTLPHALA